MPRVLILAMLAGLTLAGCGGDKKPKESDFDAAASATVTPEPRVPHVMAFDVGHAFDRNGDLLGGPIARFIPSDSLFLALRTQFAPVGADVAAHIRLGTKVVDSSSAKAGAPDSTGVAKLTMRFGHPKGWAPGAYEVEVFLNGRFEGMKAFQILP